MMLARLILSKEGAQRLSAVQPDFPIPIELGCVVGTDAAIGLLDEWNVDIDELLCSHRAWNMRVGEATPRSKRVQTVQEPAVCPRLLSAFEIDGSQERIWALTNTERDLTILLLSSEYLSR